MTISIVKPFVRSPFNYDRRAASDATALICSDESRTHQSFTEECDPNYVVDRHNRGLDITLNRARPMYGDFTGAPGSYHEALNILRTTGELFMELDAKVRAQFDNDPGKFYDFVKNPDNAEKLVEMGFATPVKEDLSIASLKDAFSTSVKDAVEKSVDAKLGSVRPSKRRSEYHDGGSGDV